MADEKTKPVGTSSGSARSSALGSSSDSPPSPEQWLEPLLARVTATIEGSTEAQGAIAGSIESIRGMVQTAFNQVQLERQAAADREKASAVRETRYERRLADLQSALGDFVGEVQRAIEGMQHLGGPIVDSRRAQEGVAKAMETFNKRIEEVTGEFKTMSRGELEGEHASPKVVRVWIVRFADFAWPHSARLGGRIAKLYALKVAIGLAGVLGLGKIISVYLKHWTE